jgi:hypothetical protein
MSKIGIIIIFVIVVTGALIVLRGGQQFGNFKQAPANTVNEVLVRRSKIPNTINQATTAKIIDVKTGRVIQASQVFSTDDKTVYLSLGLNKPEVNTRIDYIRYLNGRYVDHGGAKITQPNSQNLSFSWSVNKLIGSRPDGTYKIATYTNGILEKRVIYTVIKSKVSGFYIQEVSPRDPQYHLTAALPLYAK